MAVDILFFFVCRPSACPSVLHPMKKSFLSLPFPPFLSYILFTWTVSFYPNYCRFGFWMTREPTQKQECKIIFFLPSIMSEFRILVFFWSIKMRQGDNFFLMWRDPDPDPKEFIYKIRIRVIDPNLLWIFWIKKYCIAMKIGLDYIFFFFIWKEISWNLALVLPHRTNVK